MSDDSTVHLSESAKLGAWLGATPGAPARESSEPHLRQAVLLGVQRRKARRSRAVAASAVAGSALVVVLGLKAWVMPAASPEAIQFHVLPGNGIGQVGAYVAPNSNASLDLKFTEGSVVELEPGARARVAATTAHGATVLLETGRADVDVVHRKNAEWTIMAGPYSVRVHGTSFSVEFDPKSQLFELVMRSGVVSVEGPGISSPVQIRGAQRFVHRAGLGLDSPEQVMAPSAVMPASGLTGGGAQSVLPSSSSLKGDAADAVEGVASGNAKSLSVVSAPSWEAQVRRGEYAAVLRDAESRGLSRVLGAAGSSELMALANAARFAGRIDLGRDAYRAIRQRYGGTPPAASAAFLLGRLMEGAAPAEARSWYERYEQEAPRGALAAEAMGRRLVLTQTFGSRPEVLRLAEDYLRRFPDGSYAGVARKIVSP